MRKLSDTIARLASLRGTAVLQRKTSGRSRLTQLTDFGSNPGALQGHIYVPEALAAGGALVVVLHGCTQAAASYDTGSGWSDMADRHGFAVLFPEQQRQNNPNLCFNWFSPEDSRRGSGEALSIRQMIASVVGTYAIDPSRVFVTGLSAGGAMASVMLATYPEVFAGGAIIAGLPYGCASTVAQAFDRMRGHDLPGEAQLAAVVRGASSHPGPWPLISIWHGSADATVSPVNAGAILGQWRALHGAKADPTRVDAVDGYLHRVWCDADGREVIEDYGITGMGHGTPLCTSGEDGCGKTGAYMLEAGISSAHHICSFWGLIDHGKAAERKRAVLASQVDRELAPSVKPARPEAIPLHVMQRTTQGTSAPEGVGKVIEDALRKAGLMR